MIATGPRDRLVRSLTSRRGDTAPEVIVDGDHTVCPACKAVDSLQTVEVFVSFARLVDVHDGVPVFSLGRAEDLDPETVSFSCEKCLILLRVPDDKVLWS